MSEERHPGQVKIVCEDITKVFIQKGKQRVHVLDHDVCKAARSRNAGQKLFERIKPSG